MTLRHHLLLPPLPPMQVKPRHLHPLFSHGSAGPSPGECYLALPYPFMQPYFPATTDIDLPVFSYSALKTGGEEILRERWDTAQSRALDPDDTTSPAVVTPLGKTIGMTLPDWTRVPLMAGAPMAGVRRPVEHRAPTTQQEPVGA
jgi:hypothetical protein